MGDTGMYGHFRVRMSGDGFMAVFISKKEDGHDQGRLCMLLK
jgi:hypothetical protein